MAQRTLTDAQKIKLVKLVNDEEYNLVISLLDSISTKHAGTAMMKDKRFAIAEIVKSILKKNKDKTEKYTERIFFQTGKKICSFKSDNAKEIGVHIVWRGYNYDKRSVNNILLKISDDPNWEVREYAAGAVSASVFTYKGFYKTLEKWRKHTSENVRRAVVMSAWGIRDKRDKDSPKKAFKLLEPLMYDSSVYVRKNLGPFVLGSGYGNAFPAETFEQLDKWIKIKDDYVRWNIAMAFNCSFGNKYPYEALKYLKILSTDKNKVVRRAVISTLRALRKRHATLVSGFIKKSGIKI